jgi:hypothetical protein
MHGKEVQECKGIKVQEWKREKTGRGKWKSENGETKELEEKWRVVGGEWRGVEPETCGPSQKALRVKEWGALLGSRLQFRDIPKWHKSNVPST